MCPRAAPLHAISADERQGPEACPSFCPERLGENPALAELEAGEGGVAVAWSFPATKQKLDRKQEASTPLHSPLSSSAQDATCPLRPGATYVDVLMGSFLRTSSLIRKVPEVRQLENPAALSPLGQGSSSPAQVLQGRVLPIY